MGKERTQDDAKQTRRPMIGNRFQRTFRCLVWDKVPRAAVGMVVAKEAEADHDRGPPDSRLTKSLMKFWSV